MAKGIRVKKAEKHFTDIKNFIPTSLLSNLYKGLEKKINFALSFERTVRFQTIYFMRSPVKANR